ncbi:hypothetical protein M378DRAFT_184532 [Amanita muscaria Koide BX008]|uniref:HECT-type E3 ubiquitin transferase n=1 Tax=Amanita muscaria (strain Koide BX008) TaxID=946122 RepID=A0A0C2TQ51_AMAMK|nr:hypothetical protein M378DRAFT_184532 [Amanita muscaria Koide BX008]
MAQKEILYRTPWRPPVAVSGEGIYLELEDGRKVIDAVGGAAVSCIGNGHPKVVQAMKDQIDKLSYVYNVQLSNEPAEKLAKNLIEGSNGAFDMCLFVAGGSEAMDGIIKLARQYFLEVGEPKRTNYIARHLSFHGNTLGTLSLGYHPARRGPYTDIINTSNFHHVSPAYAKRFQQPDETEEQYVERLKQELEAKFVELGPDTVAAFAAETVVGATTGVVSAPKGYFKAMKSVCEKFGALFILDEVMSGMGRMGTLHGWQSFGDNVSPDIQAVAKGLGGGYASIGAILLSKKVADGIRSRSGHWPHGHTYQAHPISCAASLAVQEVIKSENLLENVRKQGAYLGSLLEQRLRGPNALAKPFIFDIRGGGGFWAVEFVSDPEVQLDLKGQRLAMLVQAQALKNSLIVMGMTGGANVEGTRGEHMMFAPAYNIKQEEIETIVEVFVTSVEERHCHSQEATSSSSASGSHPQIDSITTTLSTESRSLRSSARVKAAKESNKSRGKGKERDLSLLEQQPSAASSAAPTEPSSSRVTRSTSNSVKVTRSKDTTAGKSKSKAVSEEAPLRPNKRPRRNPPAQSVALTINEPPKDIKGKKRAAPEPSSGDEDIAGPSTKRPRTSYSLRSTTVSTDPSTMNRKTRSSAAKGKSPAMAKIVASTSRVADEDLEMFDAEYRNDELEEKLLQNETVKQTHPENLESNTRDKSDHSAEEMGLDSEDKEANDDADTENKTGADSTNDRGVSQGNFDESAAMAIFGDYRQIGSYMLSQSSRLKTLLNNIKSSAEPTTRLLSLQELSELLSISTEDTLAGAFPVESFVRELVRILGGQGAEEDDEDDGDQDMHDRDEDAALAAALSMSGGGYQGDENLEAQVLACRCLANLMEALPGVAHTVVYHGAIPVLCSKLIEISYIDLAEQTLSTLEKISEEYPSAIVREGGLAALLNYLDFFSIAVQRTALQAAANCCRNVSAEYFGMVRGVWSIMRNCLSYSDQRLVEFACLCVIRVIDSYSRTSVEHLESLVDIDLIKAVNQLLLPAGGSPLIATNTYTLLLRAMATSARSSSKITLTLLEADIVDTVYQILTGVLPSADEPSGWNQDTESQGLGGGIADMTVMENLGHRPKEQIEETLGLISELMPPLPKDGVFDHKAYTEKSLARLVKAKAKAERAAARQATTATVASASQPVSEAGPSTPADNPSPETHTADSGTQEPEDRRAGDAKKECAPDRTELLRSRPEAVGRFMQLTVPVLIDVYAASVYAPVRIKTLTALLKAVSFLDADGLKGVLTFVPVASFASSILSSKDHPSLVIGALQLVDLLLAKQPQLYKPTFRREGVFHEVDSLASRTLSQSPKSKDKDKDKESPSAPDSGNVTPAPMIPPSSIPGYRKLSSLSLEPEDAITLRARVIQFRYLRVDEGKEEDDSFDFLRRLNDQLSSSVATEKEMTDALRELADLFASPRTSVSSFELMQSGVVDGLLRLATDQDRAVSIGRRKELLFNAFASRKIKQLINNQTPLATLVKKLQESLTKIESFDVVTVAQNMDDSKRSSPSLLARQLRLRLQADESADIPRNLQNIVVSIHAIATFQALHDYLRPRVAGLIGSGSRLSGMLAAIAAGLGGPLSGAVLDNPPPSKSSTGPTDAATASSSTGSNSATSGPRRSWRLSAKVANSSANEVNDEGEAQAATSAQTSGSTVGSTPSDAPIHSGFAADFTDDEVGAEVFDEEVDQDQSTADKTVTLAIAEDGSKVEAQTPDGTRITTPNSSLIGAHSPHGGQVAKASYAAALKAKPTDWHLEFSMDDHVLPLDLTIYGAIHQHETRKKSGMHPSMFWQGMYTIKFKKVPGPPPADYANENSSKIRSPTPPLSSLPEDAPHAKILRLLRVLHQLNMAESERTAFAGEKRNLPESAFINNKLTAKLTRQLEEPMIVASSCLPDWALDLPQHFPFLFPFATRYNFLQSTSFGYARLILKWQSQQSRGQDSSRRDDGMGFLGRLQRQKVRISRRHILESAVKVFELYGSSSSILEVEYFEEVGTGLGPTLEFYSLVSKEFARKDLKIWRDVDPQGNGLYVHHPQGLYPAPISPEDVANDGGQKRTHIVRVIGQFVAKAMLDSRIIDLNFNKIFLKHVLGEEVPLTIASLKLVDIELANSLAKLQSMAAGHNSNDKLARKIALVEGSIEDLALDFTIPGYDIELKPGGRDIAVSSENVEEYTNAVLDAILGKGVQIQAKAFKEGFSKVFPVSDLQAFSADELAMLFGNSDEDWTIETLSEAIKADHGFNVDSKAIRDLTEVMSQYDLPKRRAFLQFITGSPKLPIGGFRGLNPPLTVVRKPHEAPLTADDYLPSVMTCVNYLKLPEYSSKLVTKEKLQTAIQEGIGSFHLS